MSLIVDVPSLPDNLIGFWHSHWGSTRPSLLDIVAYIRIIATLRRPLVFAIVSVKRCEVSGIEFSLCPPRIRRRQLRNVPGSDALIQKAIAASTAST